MFEDLKNISNLDERGMTMLENTIGKEKIESIRDEIQRLMSNENVNQNSISETAEKFGVPEKVIQLITSYYQNL